MSMEKLRSEIDEIDQKIISLLEERIDAAKKIGEEKKKRGLEIEDVKREKELLAKLKSKTGLREDFIEDLYKLIIIYCKDEER